jgi:hypothetical protein
VSKRLNEVVLVRDALGHLLPLTVGMTVAATAIATTQRLAGPIWAPAAAALVGVAAGVVWRLLLAHHFEKPVPIERLPREMRIVDARGPVRRLALRGAGWLLVAALLGSVRRHTGPSDLALTVAAPAIYGFWVGKNAVVLRRLRRQETAHAGTLLAAAGPLSGCGGKQRLFAVRSADLPLIRPSTAGD